MMPQQMLHNLLMLCDLISGLSLVEEILAQTETEGLINI